MSDQRTGRPGAERPGGGRPRPRTRNVARRELDPARLAAWEVLRLVDDQDAYANLELPRRLDRHRLAGRDAAFATELCHGTLRGRGSYDAVLAACSARPLAEIDPALLDALRLGAHQILAMRVPPHAAVAATVDLVRAEVGQGAAGFANAVLRRVTEQDAAQWLARVAPDAERDPDGHLAVTTSHPVWVIRALRDALVLSGRTASELPELLAADNAAPPVTLTALPGLAGPAELPGRAGRLSPLARSAPGDPGRVPAVAQGRARVQDEGSQLVALTLAAAGLVGDDGGRWLDLCAGPGGKSALLGAVLAGRRARGEVPDGASLTAVEPAPHRAQLVRDSVRALERTAPGLVRVHQGDGRTPPAGDGPGYDRVLVDAPCTGLGALRRRPESRWRRTPSDLAGLASLQRELLTAALIETRPGGVVGYVTCSPHPAETRLVVDDVLRRRPQASRLDAVAVARQVVAETGTGEGDLPELGPGPDLQLWPHRHGCDGMFLALLRVQP